MSGLGEHLRTAREAHDLTLDEVERRTHISLAHLAALESEQYAALPPRVYVEGMVRVYSACLGLDTAALLRDLESALGPSGEPALHPHLRDLAGGAIEVPGILTTAALVVALLVLVGVGILLWQAESVPAAGSVPPARTIPAPIDRSAIAPATGEDLLLLLRAGLRVGAFGD